MFNLAVMLEDSARKVPDRDAVVFGNQRLTYAHVNGLANRVASLLVDRGVQPGDKVALSCPNLPYFPVIYYGILKVGAVVVPLNVLFKEREVAYHLNDSDAVAYFCFEGTEDLPMGAAGWNGFTQADACEHFFLIRTSPDDEPLSPFDGSPTFGAAVDGLPMTFESRITEADDTAVILYTSGTTGQPKGAELSHANLGFNVTTNHRLFGMDPLEPDVHLVALPLFHSFGQTVQLNSGFGVGATLVLMARFDPAEALAVMQRESVTFFAGVPTMYWGLLGALTDDVDVEAIAGNLRRAVAGGASLPVEILREVKDRFRVQILEGYGLSETSPVATFSQLDRDPRPGSIGTPIWGVEVKLIDDNWETIDGADEVGEIAIRGHNVMKGYHKRPEETAAVMRDGWFRSGDLARRDEDGYYYIVDRAKDMIIRGGFNVYPREIEEVLITHPAVSLAAVVGVPHEAHGEEVKAFVIRNDGVDITEDELIAWCKEQVASYKYPRQIEFRDALPMTATGKILKRELT
ncbi:MAG: long-chain fatty acid--CoA ligase [Propionibacteriales bacterium]|nr:long-chain fatty acid--CoA ligase [Propionibacteriales bacterium]